MSEMEENPMALVESYVVLLEENDASFRGLGVRPRAAKRALLRAIAAYKRAKAAGDTEALGKAEREADRLLKEHLSRVLAVVAQPSPRDRPT